MRRSLSTWICVGAAALLAACGDAPAPAPAQPRVALELTLEAAPDMRRPVPLPAALRPSAGRAGRHAWALDAVFGGGTTRPGARVAVYTDEDEDAEPRMIRPAAPPPGQAWFLVAQDGGSPELVLAHREDPLAGTDDPEGRIPGVTRLRLILGRAPSSRPRDEEAVRERIAALLHVTIDGHRRAVTAAELARVEGTTLPGERAGARRLAWSVRTLVEVLGGDGLRLGGVEAADGRTLVVHDHQWRDADRIPWLRLNRRGNLKFYWADREGRLLRGGDLRDVTGLQLVGR